MVKIVVYNLASRRKADKICGRRVYEVRITRIPTKLTENIKVEPPAEVLLISVAGKQIHVDV